MRIQDYQRFARLSRRGLLKGAGGLGALAGRFAARGLLGVGGHP